MDVGQDQTLDPVEGKIDERGMLLPLSGVRIMSMEQTAINENTCIFGDDEFVARPGYAVLPAVVNDFHDLPCQSDRNE